LNEKVKNDRMRLTELLEKELEAFEQIFKLSEKQAKLLAKDNIDAFDSSLDEGQKYIEEIKGLHQESEPLMQSYMSGAGKDAADEIEKLRSRIQDIIAKCAELNHINSAAAKEKLENYIGKIDKLSSSRKGIGGYAQSVPNTPEMFDKLS